MSTETELENRLAAKTNLRSGGERRQLECRSLKEWRRKIDRRRIVSSMERDMLLEDR